MRELLERWSAQEPERCRKVNEAYHLALPGEHEHGMLLVWANNEFDWQEGEIKTLALIQAAVQAAIHARNLDFALRFFAPYRPQWVAQIHLHGENLNNVDQYFGETAAEALLTAYLAVLEEREEAK